MVFVAGRWIFQDCFRKRLPYKVKRFPPNLIEREKGDGFPDLEFERWILSLKKKSNTV